jgi:TonB family protein
MSKNFELLRGLEEEIDSPEPATVSSRLRGRLTALQGIPSSDPPVRMKIACPQCGHGVPVEWRICLKCGTLRKDLGDAVDHPASGVNRGSRFLMVGLAAAAITLGMALGWRVFIPYAVAVQRSASWVVAELMPAGSAPSVLQPADAMAVAATTGRPERLHRVSKSAAHDAPKPAFAVATPGLYPATLRIRQANARPYASAIPSLTSDGQIYNSQYFTLVSAPQSPMRVEALPRESLPTLIRRVEPEYPIEALRQRIEGPVVLKVLISEEGAVYSVRAVTGNRLLVPAAIAAVKQWQYRPRMVYSQPREAEAIVVVKFSLPQMAKASAFPKSE